MDSPQKNAAYHLTQMLYLTMNEENNKDTAIHKLILIVMEAAIFIGFLYWYFK